MNQIQALATQSLLLTALTLSLNTNTLLQSKASYCTDITRHGKNSASALASAILT